MFDIVKQRVEIWNISHPDPMRFLERIGRTAWKSEGRITEDSAEPFVRGLLTKKHESVIEHVYVTAWMLTNRLVTHELVRHRLASYTQESTRYVNYAGTPRLIEPIRWDEYTEDQRHQWTAANLVAIAAYERLRDLGLSKQEARDVLPHDLAAEIVITANLRTWRHIFNLRCDIAAYPQFRSLTHTLRASLREMLPVIFNSKP